MIYCLCVPPGLLLLWLLLRVVRNVRAAASTPKQPRATRRARRAGWRRLQTGMTQWEVQQILGLPLSTDNLAARARWYYGEGKFGGSVLFRDGKVVKCDRARAS